MKTPDFIIAGEARCGTTSLYEDLIKHPQILPATPTSDVRYDNGNIYLSQKEPRFFDKNWFRGPNWYYTCFQDREGTITGEASATYLYKTLSMARIKQLLPDVKIIILLRNPVDRLYSHFHHIKKFAPKWDTRYPTFERFIESAHENDYYIIDKGMYAKSIKVCFDLFDVRQVHIVRSEDLFENPETVYVQLLETLSVDPFSPIEFSALRSSNPSIKMPNHVRKMLTEFYAPYNAELEDIIGRKMKWG